MQVLGLKKDDKVSNPSKLRVDLRFYAELISVGVFTLKARGRATRAGNSVLIKLDAFFPPLRMASLCSGRH